MEATARARDSRKRAATTPLTQPGAPPVRKITISGGTPLPPGMVDMWRDGKLCDANIKAAEGCTFAAHRHVLMGVSDFLYGLFEAGMTESQTAEVTLPDVEAAAVEAALTFMYTGECEMAEPELPALLHAATFMQIKPLITAVGVKFADFLTPENCLDIWELTGQHCPLLDDLARMAKEKALRHFEDVYNTSSRSALAALTHAHFSELLHDERLTVNKEDSVHMAIVDWARAQQTTPDDDTLLPLFKTVRYPLVSREYFESIVANEPLLQGALGAKIFASAFVAGVHGPRIRLRKGFAPSRPRLTWSANKKASHIALRDDGHGRQLAACTSSSATAPSVLSVEPLPRTGRHLVELVYERGGHDRNLGGRYWTGVMSAAAAVGAELDARRRWKHPESFEGFWGFEDHGYHGSIEEEYRPGSGFGVRRGYGANERAPNESLCDNRIFSNGDRVGLVVDMDDRTMEVLRNGEPIPGLVFTDLPETGVFVVASPFNNGATVRFVDEE